MSRKATKAIDNVFYQARIEASKFNDCLSSREGASEKIGIDRTRLARIELGSLNPYPEEVLLMSDMYNTPELNNFYCSNLCPLGKQTIQPIQVCEIERLTIQILAVLNGTSIERIKDSLIDITEDGKITKDEEPRLKEIIDTLDKISAKSQALKLWAEKHLIINCRRDG
jgi:hypothetical protein